MTEPWEHLKAYGYAPGNYINQCRSCFKMCHDLDKRAWTCRGCAEQRHLAKATVDALRNANTMTDDLPPTPLVMRSQSGREWPVYTADQMCAYGDARAAAAVAQERERCAKLCESMRPVMLPEPRPPNEDVERGYSAGLRRAADAIRAGS